MAFCRVVFPLLVLSVISCSSASNVPVFIWGDTNADYKHSNPLTTYSSVEFSKNLKKLLSEDPLTLVFLEENLSVEDFSQKNEESKTSFPYLETNIHNSIYLPKVEDALIAVNQTAGPSATNIFLTESGLSQKIEPNAGKFIIINLDDAVDGESRLEMLRRHNDYMQETIQNVSENLKYVALYTAKNPSWTNPASKSRVRRAAETAPRATRMYTLDGLRFTTTQINVKTGNDSRTLADVTDQSSVLNTTSVNATLTFDNTTLTLNFISQAGYWFFDTVILTMGSVTDTLYPDDEVFAILGFSYRCAQHVSFSSRNGTKTYSVSFEDLKVQPFFETNTTQEFGDSFNCVGFFSAPIWAGLFVVFILLSITFYGIMMMLDIRTMDRFDDPKGKTITINAE